jgi:Tfp pilus assembly protein PilZ
MSSNPEQRDNTRFAHVSAVTYEDLEKGVYAQSKMFNYSSDGLYFESDLKLEVGEKIFIGIENSPYAKQSGTYECYHAVIKRRQALEHSVYKYGYGVLYSDPGLSQEPAGAQAESTASRPPPPAGGPETASKPYGQKENRRHKRIHLSRAVDCFSKDRPFRGTVKNIAPSGAFIETDQPFEIGEKLTLALPFVKKGEGAMVKAEVVWKNELGIGVKFKKAVRK